MNKDNKCIKKFKHNIFFQKGANLYLCLLFLFVCLLFNFPLNLLKANEQENGNQTSVNDIIMFAVASEDTGASSAPSSEKGGCHYLGAGTKMTMSSGTITGKKNKYGGAVFISDGAIFTMSGGTISSCKATYGGAIYVASGGTLNMTGGKIEKCKANYAPAIYVEENATVTINGEIVDCTYPGIEDEISTDTIMVGKPSTGKAFHYLDYGTYPQTYVGDTMNSTLESWYSSNSPTAQTTYEIRTRTWTSYLYTDGNYYARGSSYPYSSSYTYVDGTTVKSSGTITWFKVEPIRWIILNYDEVMAETATTIDCLSELGLTADIRFYPNKTDTDCNAWYNSELRTWLNSKFINQAFTSDQQEKIATTTVLNNVAGDGYIDGTGTTTEDKIYLLSYYEANTTYFSSIFQRLCSPTDFALGNYANKNTNSSYPTTLYPSGGTSWWWLRSSGSLASCACFVSNSGSVVDYLTSVNTTNYAVRPALSFTI